MLEALVNGEFFATDSDNEQEGQDSNDAFWRARVQVWSALQVSPGLQAYALVEAETDDFDGSWESEADIEELALRYTHNDKPWFQVEAGRILAPIESVYSYPLSTQNPLIDQPNSHYGAYPLGIQFNGSTRRFDYRLAWVDEAVPDVGLPGLDPDSAYRPELVAGFTPFVGFRIGVSYARGPYLNEHQNEYLAPGDDWKNYDQSFAGLDVEFSRGYAQLRGGYSRSEYDLPFQTDKADATDAYFEFKYTWTPRVYTTLRLQRTTYEAIDLEFYTYAAGPREKATAVEIGVGYRFSADTQLKLELRTYNSDDDEVFTDPDYEEEYSYDYGTGGIPADTVIALQFSHHFDFRPRYGAGN